MQTFIEKYNIQEEFSSLPESYQRAILSINWEEIIWDIAKKQGFMLDETTILIEEVGLVLFGAEKSTDLATNISDHTKLLDKEIEKFIRELNIMIFIPLQEKMKNIEQEKNNHPSRDEILDAVQNPHPELSTITSAEKKLEDFFHIPPATSDYTIKETPVKQTGYNGNDPYHEPIE